MTDGLRSQGDQLLLALSKAQEQVLLCAPFMKLRTVRRLLDVVAQGVQVHIVTRWHPSEVRLGVSDLEIFDLVEGHPDTQLFLLDDLHAKLYVSDADALTGSSNLTAKGLGWSQLRNVEILLPVSKDAPEIVACLEQIAKGRPATKEEKERVAARAAALADLDDALSDDIEEGDTPGLWLPSMSAPARLYDAYNPQLRSRLSDAVFKSAKNDLKALDLPLGLTRSEFQEQVGSRFLTAPAVAFLLEKIEKDELNDHEAMDRIAALPINGALPIHRQWEVVREWLTTFHGDRIEIVADSFVTRRRPGTRSR